MCGIAGFVDFSRGIWGDGAVIKGMTATLSPRGPDDVGFWCQEHVFFGHRRLAVVDPTGGGQPMVLTYKGATYCIVYNGELYNTEDLRSELLTLGHVFESRSDTEVLLHAYAAWGDSCVMRLNGIFAFAVWDGARGCLFLARDRIGVKPLFFAQRGTCFIFASELKALLAHPLVTPRLSREGLNEIFALGPARTPGHGVFDDVKELKPGGALHFDRVGLRHEKYWMLCSQPHEESFEETVSHVRALVLDAVRRQLVSDVPLCVLLSGGLDSSAIAAIASEVYEKEGRSPLRSFSVDYRDNDTNFTPNAFQPNPDAPWIKIVADYLGTHHETCLLDTPELTEALFPAVLARDLPGMADVDASLLLFSRWIKSRATVGLSGECADEVFGGYPWFYSQSERRTFPWSQRLDARLSILSQDLVDWLQPRRYIADRYEEALAEVPRLQEDSPEEARLRELFWLNLTRWMPTLLDRKDRMSMFSGLELRVPFCDHRLVEYVWNIPWSMKNYKGREKGLLRHALEGLLPEEVLWRKKSPYPKTHNPNYIDALRQLMLRLLDDSTAPLLSYINVKTVRDLALTVDKNTSIPWFGQLMNAPQLLAYLLQINYWLVSTM